MIEVDDYKSWVWISTDGRPVINIEGNELPLSDIINHEYFKSVSGYKDVKNWLLENFGHYTVDSLIEELPWAEEALKHSKNGMMISCVGLCDVSGMNIINNFHVLGY
ncbi:hypothetical protein OFDDKENP_00093 [Aeromonas phage B614]|nr:hypothetical protein OFDDKENP_00093 [Aeromonas phage B614]UYD58180.1 hypothetical protein JNEOFJEA_00083 [Aeromonas phage UP87]UYD59997.1 hypothetical protein LEHPIFIF_00241 [Aeromonas phage avDM9-HANS]